MDVFLTQLIDDLIRWVDDRCGRTIAWIVAIAATGLLISVPLTIIWYLLG